MKSEPCVELGWIGANNMEFGGAHANLMVQSSLGDLAILKAWSNLRKQDILIFEIGVALCHLTESSRLAAACCSCLRIDTSHTEERYNFIVSGSSS
jgi:hypothetical protein